MDYQGKRVVIVGLGISGVSCIDYFLAQGVLPRVVDTRATPPGIDNLDPRLECHFGELPLAWLLESDLIVVSPGIALSEPALQQAASQGKSIVGDVELFCREINRRPGKQIVAITGSNGKTTVTTLLGEIIQAAGIKVAVGGNIGQPALSLLQQDADVYVLELSSFQLETTSSLRASVATILNVSEDHMDRYPQGMTQYIAAKQRIYHQARCCLSYYDDPQTAPMLQSAQYALTVGNEAGDYSLDPQKQWLVAHGEKVLMVAQMQLSGLHNYLNTLFALAMADELNVARQVSLAIIKQFKGLPHRFELVWSQHGVQWINDSKATNVGSTVAALNSVVCNGQLHLLLGGDGKAADFTPLKPYLQRQNLTIYTFGRDRHALSQLNPAVTVVVETLAEAMTRIANNVNTGDVVLLSPACASLDQFKNYLQRGELFSRLARELGK